MAYKKTDKQIESKLLLMVLKTANEQRNTETHIRVVDWISGTKHYPQLEKREFFFNQDGELKIGKAKGFNIADLIFVKSKWPEIMRALGSKLPEDQISAAPAGEEAPAAASTQQDEAPESDF